MDLESRIKELMTECKSDQEIAETLLSEEKSLDTDAIADAIAKARKSADVIKKLSEKKAEDDKIVAAKTAQTAQAIAIKEGVDAHLKSINFDPTGDGKDVKIHKTWDMAQAKMIDCSDDQFSDSYKRFNTLLTHVANGRTEAADGISKEIAQENDIQHQARHGVKATLRSDSDSVGGYAVPTEVESKIHQLSYAQSVMMPNVNRNVVIMEDKIYPTIGDISMVWITNQDTATTESNPTMSNPTVNMERTGAFTRISNDLIGQKGVDLTGAISIGYASAMARFIDEQLVIGNITGAADKLDGLVWLGTAMASTVAIADLSISTLTGMTETIDDEADDAATMWIGNRKIYNKIGLFESTGGNKIFPQFLSGGKFEPLGFPIIKNSKITSVLDIGGDNSTGGTDDALILADLSKFVVGVDGGMKIALSEHEAFTKDVTTFRGIQRIGWAVLFSAAVQVQEVTAT